ncbi:hypothetical protein IT157_07120 [bacterium]|nr:hypothetical protein [bacterium]
MHNLFVQLRRLIGLTIMVTLLASVTVPYYCATGWCCGKGSEQVEQKKDVPSCCAHKQAEETPVRKSGDSCCNDEDTNNNSGCPMGCSKLASSVFVLAADLIASPNLNEETTLQKIDQAVPSEYIDYIPKPPLALSA